MPKDTIKFMNNEPWLCWVMTNLYQSKFFQKWIKISYSLKGLRAYKSDPFQMWAVFSVTNLYVHRKCESGLKREKCSLNKLHSYPWVKKSYILKFLLYMALKI